MKIARRFGETELINSVVITIRPEEDIGHGTHSVVRAGRRFFTGGAAGVKGEIEDASGAGGASGGVDAIGSVNIESGVDIVAGGYGVAGAIGNPAQIIEGWQFANVGNRAA